MSLLALIKNNLRGDAYAKRYRTRDWPFGMAYDEHLCALEEAEADASKVIHRIKNGILALSCLLLDPKGSITAWDAANHTYNIFLEFKKLEPHQIPSLNEEEYKAMIQLACLMLNTYFPLEKPHPTEAVTLRYSGRNMARLAEDEGAYITALLMVADIFFEAYKQVLGASNQLLMTAYAIYEAQEDKATYQNDLTLCFQGMVSEIHEASHQDEIAFVLAKAPAYWIYAEEKLGTKRNPSLEKEVLGTLSKLTHLFLIGKINIERLEAVYCPQLS